MESLSREQKTFVVHHKEPQLLVPSKPTPHEIKQLSDIDDQKGLRFHFTMIMFYRSKNSNNNNVLTNYQKDPVETIRDALAQALVWYYPLSGRLIQGPKDKLMVDCKAQGISFIEANCNFSIEELEDGDAMKPPCLYSKELLCQVFGSHEMIGFPLMVVQVTRLICGGFVVAIRVNHVLCDALGLIQFIKAVEELSQGASSPSIKPIWSRQLLTSNYLPIKTTYQHPEYDVVNNYKNDNNNNNDDVVSQCLFFGPKEISVLRCKLSSHICSVSKFSLITALIWRSRTIALGLKPEEIVSVSCMVSVRGKCPISLQSGYYGNTVVTPAAVAEAGRLCDSPLDYAIELIENVKNKVDKDYVRSVVRYMDLNGRPALLRSKNNFIISDTSNVGFDMVDFGWGKPVYGGTMDGGSVTNAIYAKYKNNRGEKGVMVPVFLPSPTMKRFLKEMKKMMTLDSSDEFSKPLIIRSSL